MTSATSKSNICSHHHARLPARSLLDPEAPNALEAWRAQLAADLRAAPEEPEEWCDLDDCATAVERARWSLPGTSEQVAKLADAITAARIAQVTAVMSWDAEARWSWDGALSPESWLQHRCGWSRAECRELVAVARLCRRIEAAHDALHGDLERPGRGPCRLTFAQLVIWAGVVTPARAELFEAQAREVLAACERLDLRRTATAARVWAQLADDRLGLGQPGVDGPARNRARIRGRDGGGGDLEATLDDHTIEVLVSGFERVDRPDPDDGPEPPRSREERFGDYLAHLAHLGAAETCAAADRPTTPTHTVLVIAKAEQAGVAVTAEGAVVDHARLERYLCSGWHQALVVDEHGQPLWLSRRQRLFTGSQRAAIVVRDRHCRFPGCGAPPSWCDVHHAAHWEHGGTTDVANGVLVCHRHHRLLHQRGWAMVRDPIDGSWRLDRFPPPRAPGRPPP